MKSKKSLKDHMYSRAAMSLSKKDDEPKSSLKINPSVFDNVTSGDKPSKINSYGFGLGGNKQSQVGGGVSMNIGKRGSISASGFRGKDEYGKYGNYEIKGGLSIPIGRSKKKKK
jgi:hypothetical protein